MPSCCVGPTHSIVFDEALVARAATTPGVVFRASREYNQGIARSWDARLKGAVMAESTLAQVIEILEDLNVEELKQVQEAVQKRLQPRDEAAAERAFEQALLASGLVKEIKRPTTRPAWDRPLITIQGEPLSETIIRERR